MRVRIISSPHYCRRHSSNLPYRISHAVVCVGACDSSYKKWVKSNSRGSNWGSRVDMIGPGVDIWSASNDNDSGVKKDSGTSMATPWVSGVAAIFLGYEPIQAQAQLVRSRLMSNQLVGVVTGFDDKTDNHLINSGINNPDRFEGDPYKDVWHEPGFVPVPVRRLSGTVVADAVSVDVDGASSETTTTGKYRPASLYFSFPSPLPLTTASIRLIRAQLLSLQWSLKQEQMRRLT